MASYQWIKLYDEILDDPKMGRLSDGAYRFCINLFLLASRQEARDGSLPELTDVAWALRLPEETAAKYWAELEKVGIVCVKGGVPTVCKFQDRQKAVDGKERVKQFRERQQRKPVTQENEPVTNDKRASNESVTKSYTDIDIDKEKNIYIAPLSEPMTKMISSLTKASKTPYGAGYNEEIYEQAASLLLRQGFTPEQVDTFPEYWLSMGWGWRRGLPTLEKVVEEMGNCVNRVDTRTEKDKAASSSNGSNGHPATEDPAIWKLVTEAVSLGNYKGLTPEQIAAIKRVGPMAIKDRNDFTANRVRADFFKALQGAKC